MTDTATTLQQRDRVRELVNEAMRDGILIGVNFAANAAASLSHRLDGAASSTLKAFADQLKESGPKMASDAVGGCDSAPAQLSERDLTVISFALGKFAEEARRRANVAAQAASGPYGAERLLKDAVEAEDVQRKVGLLLAAMKERAE